MAEPPWKTPPVRRETPAPDEEPGITVLRWVERPDGRMEQVDLPLTVEMFLNPRIGDQILQGRRHSETILEVGALLIHHFRSSPDTLVLCDHKLFLGPGLPDPGPDLMVLRGVRNKQADRESFDVVEEGVAPSLIVEVVSPLDSEIRKADLEDKVRVYERAGIPEYLIVDSTRPDRRFRLLGYRLDAAGRYQPIEPDAEGRLLSLEAGLWFQVSPDGNRLLLSEHPSGKRLLNLEETVEHLRRAEEETARLRKELERLRGQS
jgi:Uma2 family endonuclease